SELARHQIAGTLRDDEDGYRVSSGRNGELACPAQSNNSSCSCFRQTPAAAYGQKKPLSYEDRRLSPKEDADYGFNQTHHTGSGRRGSGNGRLAARICPAGEQRRNWQVLRKRPRSNLL